MPLFLITSLYDEGISPNCFRVVEADSKLAVAQYMLKHPQQWSYFLYRSPQLHLEDEETCTPQQWLNWVARTHVDGDSEAQLRIHEITVQPLESLQTNPPFSATHNFQTLVRSDVATMTLGGSDRWDSA